VANAAYGDADAFLVVVFDNVGGNNIEEIFSSVYQKQITEEETEEDALAAMQDGNRRLLQVIPNIPLLRYAHT
jgi:serine/threonine protein phosphatase PrpC